MSFRDLIPLRILGRHAGLGDRCPGEPKGGLLRAGGMMLVQGTVVLPHPETLYAVGGHFAPVSF